MAALAGSGGLKLHGASFIFAEPSTSAVAESKAEVAGASVQLPCYRVSLSVDAADGECAVHAAWVRESTGDSGVVHGSYDPVTEQLQLDLTTFGGAAASVGTFVSVDQLLRWNADAGCEPWQLIDATMVAGGAVEQDQEAKIGALADLTATQLKIEMMFTKFDKDGDGLLNYSEFCDMEVATEETPQQISDVEFRQILLMIGCPDPGRGMDMADLNTLYVGPAAEAFGTDLNADFAMVFPAEARVSMIFDAFDADQDGRLARAEFATYVATTAHEPTDGGSSGAAAAAAADEEGDAGAANDVWLYDQLAVKPDAGMSLASFLSLYVGDDALLAEHLDSDFQLAGERLME